MNANNIRLLNREQLATWVNASKYFSRKQINDLITQTPLAQSHALDTDAFYEIRRIDIPEAFDSLLKLQNTGAATRHIETSRDEAREVLRVNIPLLDGIMLILTTLIESILRLLSLDSDGARTPPSMPSSTNAPPPIKEVYVPTWKRQEQLIGYAGPSL